MPSPIIPVLLAGGAGTRLWPVSRDALPKQFLPLVGDRSTYQETLLRVRDPMFAPPIVITGPNFHFFARRQAEEIGVEATVVIEPLRRDSAAAIAAATAVARQRDPQAVVLALAADHIILDVPQFRATCLAGRAAAEAGRIVTFGIKPTEPKTSYGYILPGERHRQDRRARGQALRREAGRRHRRHLCARRLSVEFRQLPVPRRRAARPNWRSSSRRWPRRSRPRSPSATTDLGFLRLQPDAFARAPQKSIDYAVMEKTDRAAVVTGDFRWSDIGSWDALFDITPPRCGRQCRAGPGGDASTPAVACSIPTGDSITAVGVKDLGGGEHIGRGDGGAARARTGGQGAGRQAQGGTSAPRRPTTSACTGRGAITKSIDMGERFQVKRIVVIPGGMLSLQKHHHRAEHWVVVRGTAEVTIGETVTAVHENESVYIPIGSVHRLANQGKIPLELIEVQTGSYLGEDDIERIEDIYKRN